MKRNKPFTILKKIVALLVVIVAFACGGDREEPDTIPPEITIEGDNPLVITLPGEYTELGATALDDTDGDLSDSIEITTTADFLVPGSYEVTYSVSDAAGNATSSIRYVVILPDTTAPVITIVGDNPLTIILPAEYTELGAIASDDTDGVITDLIEITSTVDIDVPGSYVVTYSVSDAAGNSTSVTREVIIVAGSELDTTAPEITILGDNPLTITLPTEYMEQGATASDDTDGDISDRIEITTTADFLVPGNYEVTYSVSDAAGNSTSVTREVIIIVAGSELDTTAPEITILGDNPLTITLPTEYMEQGATASDDTDGDISDRIEITTTADFLVPGTYEVTYSVSDAAGNSTSVTREVIIVAGSELDTTAPELTILGDNPLTIDQYVEYTELGAYALDNIDGDITDSIEITSTVDIDVPGTYEVTYSVSDAAGNSTSVTREVIVVAEPDTTAPEITIIGGNPLTISQYSQYMDAGATASDDTDGDISDQIVIENEVNINLNGSYDVTYTVTDVAGNSTRVTREVIVDNAVYLDTNGITVKANDWAVVGDFGIINAEQYTIVDLATLEEMISNDEDVTHVCTTLITNMASLFSGNETFNQDIGSWDVSNVTSIRVMFLEAHAFNQDIGNWDVSSADNFDFMFSQAYAFNQDISNWDVSKGISFISMFSGAENFNCGSDSDIIGIGAWTISKTVDDGEIVPVNMQGMFLNAFVFNNDISDWDVSNVTNMGGMFYNALAFNQPIGSWDVGNVDLIGNMFGYSSDVAFYQDLSGWDIGNVSTCGNSGQFTESTSTWPQPVFTSENGNCYEGN